VFLYFDLLCQCWYFLLLDRAVSSYTGAVEVKMLVRWRNVELSECSQHRLSPVEPALQPGIPSPVNDVSVDQVLGVVIQNL